MSSKTIIYRLFVLSIITALANGCVVEPNLKISGKPPDIIKSYKHVNLMGGNSKMKDTGVRIEKGEVYTVLVAGSIDYCPRGGCQWRRVTPDLGWPFIARVGDPGTSSYFRPLSAYYNSHHFTRTHYSPPGNLFVGYKEGPVDSNGNALRPEWYSDDSGAFSVDVIVWQTEDWIKIADFLEKRFRADPENVTLKEAYEHAAKYRKIELARKETSRALEETQNQIKTIAQEAQLKKAPPPAEHSLPMDTEPAVGAGDASENRVAALEAKLQKLTLMLASLEDMKKQLNEERKKSEQLAAERDEFEAREKDLLTKLEDGSRVSPVIVIASPKSQTRTEAGKITLSGVVQDDKGIDSLEIFINDKRTTGAFERAVAVTGAGVSKSVDFSETLSLQKGENRIRIRAVDTDGLVAEKKLVIQRLEIRRNVWAVVIGINTYAKVTNLLYAANDARAFYRILVEKNRVPKENVTLLLNEDAVLSKLRSLLGTQLKKNAGKEDMVIIYFAGHGATERDTISPDGDGLEKYLLPADADPEDLYATALPMRELSHIFNRLRSERLVFIADACYSGATGGRTISINTGLRARISDNFLERISSGKGRIILSASGANEVSAEKPEMKHGVFTNFLIRGLDGEADANHDGLITVDEIYNYVSTQVPLATGQEQHPVKKGTVEGQLVLGVVN